MREAFIGKDDLPKLIERWARDYRVYVPVTFDIMNHEATPDYQLVAGKAPETMRFAGAALAHTPKSFLFYPRETVATYPGGGPEAAVEASPTVLVGPRGCDLRANRKYDKVYWSTKHFTEEYDDPFYIDKRRQAFIVSLDCSAPKETCFCTRVGGRPYPDEGDYDLNLAPVEGGFIVSVGSEKGEKLLVGSQDLTTPVLPEQLEERTRGRRSVTEAIDRQNAKFEMDGPPDGYDLESTPEAWAFATQNCVSCGACNRCCPSCTCFLLVDQAVGAAYERNRIWDQCLSIGFARTAGGANARPAVPQRLQQRLRCKFEYTRDRYGLVTCTGCGRCIDVCMGRIDMREAIRHVLAEKAKA